MHLRPIDPRLWRWCGDALVVGEIPDGRTPARMMVLRNLLELGADASDADVEAELQLFKAHGKRRV